MGSVFGSDGDVCFGSDGECYRHTVECNFLAYQRGGTRSCSEHKHREAIGFSVTSVGSNRPALFQPSEEFIAVLLFNVRIFLCTCVVGESALLSMRKLLATDGSCCASVVGSMFS